MREYGPFAGADNVHGVTHDGRRVWAATGASWSPSIPPAARPTRTLDRAGDAGTAFDGTHLYQIAEARIDKIDPATGEVRGVDPRARPGQRLGPGLGRGQPVGRASTATARSTRSIPATGAILRTIESNRFVTGVTWVDGELWHGTWEGDESEIRRIDPAQRRRARAARRCRAGTGVSGLESDGAELSTAAAAAAARCAPCAARSAHGP